MAYQGLDNRTDFSADMALLANEKGRDVLLVLVKSCYDIADDGRLSLSKKQAPICFEGKYVGEPGLSSLTIAPEANFDKLATDVVLVGHAYAPNGEPVSQFDVGLQVATLRQHICVLGDRVWQKRVTAKGLVTWVMTQPQPVTKMPLIYEKAFGGQDLTPADKKHQACEPRNLLGTGLIAKHSQLDEVALPNLEDPNQLIQSPSDRPQPMGMGFVSPDCQPRLGYSGTYDKHWEQTRLPMLPLDFDRKFFNAAHPALIAPGFLNGHEVIHLTNACPSGKLSLQMPGDRPAISIQFRYEESKRLDVKLDTVLVNTDDMTLTLLWRATEDVFNRIYEMEEIMVEELEESKKMIPEGRNKKGEK